MKLKMAISLLSLFVLVAVVSAQTFIVPGHLGGATPCSGNYGNQTQEPDSLSYLAGSIWCQRTTLSPKCGGDLEEFHAYMSDCDVGTKEIAWGVYADDGYGNDPAGLIWNSAATNADCSSGFSWVDDTTMSEAIPSADYIWICVMFESNDTFIKNDEDDGTTSGRSVTATFGSWPPSWPTGTDVSNTRDLSLYVVF